MKFIDDDTCDTEKENRLPTSRLSMIATPNDEIFEVHGKTPDNRFTDILK